MNLCKNVKITKVQAASTAATSAINTSSVDMSGWDGVLFFGAMGTANAANYINAATSSDDSTFNDLEDTKVTPTGNGEVAWLDIYKPQERYLRLEVARGASTTFGDVYAIQYEGFKLPADNVTAGTITGELHISPDEGTA